MPSIAHQKVEHQDWISEYFERYVPTLTVDEARELVLWCVWKLAASMTLSRLEVWRGNLEARGEITALPLDEPGEAGLDG